MYSLARRVSIVDSGSTNKGSFTTPCLFWVGCSFANIVDNFFLSTVSSQRVIRFFYFFELWKHKFFFSFSYFYFIINLKFWKFKNVDKFIFQLSQPRIPDIEVAPKSPHPRRLVLFILACVCVCAVRMLMFFVFVGRCFARQNKTRRRQATETPLITRLAWVPLRCECCDNPLRVKNLLSLIIKQEKN